ncbi:hypothetical protein [Candidatus Thiosymbion oneisti]|uniref:DUF7832 domain-containing protein n=1 Tax=Candidatus Thiosymbion oneisti TaxID=589554 RepID=UPI00105B5892|nr:hypothetical protein [Candidatus Thiosymbion oneisti]
MKYDDSTWHFGGEFPEELDERHAGIHIGMFLGWIIRRGLYSELLSDLAQDDILAVQNRLLTGTQFLQRVCDGKLTNEDLNEEANLFAQDYYASDDYIDDYSQAFIDIGPTLYHVTDDNANALKVEDFLDKAFQTWKISRG